MPFKEVMVQKIQKKILEEEAMYKTLEEEKIAAARTVDEVQKFF